ncbi:eukaryotic translation initiation factor 4B3 isoform X1 [Hevea brasiliensis]|uniref:eukaryotic translation initiation factor 4B3 isoform X1 n=1 Tax=Hevea brasiliensis TaxID=3981 RepID=UPI0025D593D3|nr:eukaryotic translation initiation factor 4B3 isoform X1 [Hevea brasiliensis]
MAATASSPWGKPGAWALDAEEHEDELRQQQFDSPHKIDDSSGESGFPSLAAAAKNLKKKKKMKKQALSLAEFTAYDSSKSDQPTQYRGLAHDDLLNLPTGPRQRSAEELHQSRLGGGFKSHGMSNRNGDDSSNSRWGGGHSRFSSRDRDTTRDLAPSRADETDDWSKSKKSTVGNGYERRERGSFFDSLSKADELDSWVANKPTEARRYGATKDGFERRGSFDSLSRDRNGSNSGGAAADSDNWGRKKEEVNGTASSRPKLILQPRTVPVNNENGAAAKPKGSSPFGDARPREEVLAEKGKDWKEIDEKLQSVNINSKKEIGKGERGNSTSIGRWSFGNGRGGSGTDRVERSWRKPDAADSNSRPQSCYCGENDFEVNKKENSLGACLLCLIYVYSAVKLR